MNPGFPASTIAGRLSLTPNRSGYAWCSVSADVVRHRRPDQLQQGQRAHRQAERVERGVGHVERGTGVDGRVDLAEEAGQQPVDHERRARP